MRSESAQLHTWDLHVSMPDESSVTCTWWHPKDPIFSAVCHSCHSWQLTPSLTASWPMAKVHSWQSLTYQNLAVNPEGCPLLGMKWQDKYFGDMVLSLACVQPCLFSVPLGTYTWSATLQVRPSLHLDKLRAASTRLTIPGVELDSD